MNVARFLSLSFLLSIALIPGTRAQSSDPWPRFRVPGTERTGYKDRQGRVRIPARKVRVIADTFHHIIVVEDPDSGPYYLLKGGRRIGADSLYYFDNAPDCESEGLIRFRDRKSDRVGFFDSAGNVAIPAVYNTVSAFQNGLAVAHRNGRRECADRDTSNCEHWIWTGGEQVLINRSNEVLVDNWNLDSLRLNWYSFGIDLPALDTTPGVTVRGNGGRVYRFIDYRAEFERWFQTRFLPAARSGKPLESHLLHSSLVNWDGKRWKTVTAAAFARTMKPGIISAKLSPARLEQSDIFNDDLNPYIYEGKAFQPYYTSCGDAFSGRYPAFSIVVTRTPRNGPAGETVQDHFSFLRTDAGYRLIGVSFPD